MIIIINKNPISNGGLSYFSLIRGARYCMNSNILPRHQDIERKKTW